MKLLAASVALMSALAAHADAMCGVPMWNGTPPSDIPLHGSLYVFDAGIDDLRYSSEFARADEATIVAALRERGGYEQQVSSVGLPVATHQVLISASVVRIDYTGHAGSSLIVNNTNYTLVPGWHPPLASPRVVSFTREQFAWTCSSHDALHATIDQPTAAIRALWQHEGITDEWIVPARKHEQDQVLMLGDINCAGTTLDTKQLDAGGHLELFAIYPDGTEVPISGLPDWITSSTIPTHGSLERDREPESESESESDVIVAPEAPASTGRRILTSILFLLGAFAIHRGVSTRRFGTALH